MIYLLDSNICISIINRKQDGTLQRLQACPAGEVGISSITVAELRYGAAKSMAAMKNNAALDYFFLPLEIAVFDDKAAHAYGSVRAELEKMGTPIGPLDTLIAAHAIALGTTLVTNNMREFKRVKRLTVEDWT